MECIRRRGGGLGSSTIFKNLMSPTPRRKWYLTTGRRAYSMVVDPIPQSLPVHFFGSRPQPPTSHQKTSYICWMWSLWNHRMLSALARRIWRAVEDWLVPSSFFWSLFFTDLSLRNMEWLYACTLSRDVRRTVLARVIFFEHTWSTLCVHSLLGGDCWEMEDDSVCRSFFFPLSHTCSEKHRAILCVQLLPRRWEGQCAQESFVSFHTPVSEKRRAILCVHPLPGCGGGEPLQPWT